MATTETRIELIPASQNLGDNASIVGVENTSHSGPFHAIKYGGLNINTLTETVQDYKGSKIQRVIPRPIITGTPSNSGGFPSAVTTGAGDTLASTWAVRMAKRWSYNNQIISYVMTNGSTGSVYTGPTPILGTRVLNGLTAPTGQVGGTDFFDGTNQYFVVSWADARPYYISTGGVATQIADVDCPSGAGTSPHIVYLDGALFIAKNNAIHNSEFGAITNWPGYSRTKEQYADIILALAKHRNSIVAFGRTSIEFFYNAGYSGVSPLNRQETYATKLGLFDTGSVLPAFVEAGDDLVFLGETVSNEVGLYKISNFKLQKVSTYHIDRILNTYSVTAGNNKGNIHVSYLPFRGHNLILVQCDESGWTSTSITCLTLVYDINENKWGVWTARNTSSAGTKSFNVGETAGTEYIQNFPFDFFFGGRGFGGGHTLTTIHTQLGDEFALEDASMGGTTTTDASSLVDYDESATTSYPVDFLVRTPTILLGNHKQKHIKRLFLSGIESRNSGTRPDINVYVFTSSFKEDSGSYPTPITLASYDDPQSTNLSTGRKFIIECQWSGGYWSSFNGLELHYNEGEQ